MINEKAPTEKNYVIILRNNAAIEVDCTDVYTQDNWVQFKDEIGILVMAVPIDLILMITTPDRFAVFQRAAKDERARQTAQVQSETNAPIINVDPQGILDPLKQIIQP